ncbi:MAG: bacteriochlorophyll 4-vinyl reductase [Gammaproteobacteria bacterium]|nr:bacteriochlorophyll 4-vinyl reductase [Gammaproteobacteria bacterium]
MARAIGLAAPERVAASTAQIATIGPNAITRMAEALTQLADSGFCDALFAECAMQHYRAQPPQSMVDERDVIRLHAVARQRLGMAAYRPVARRAGELTGEYVQRHRIPGVVRLSIRALPRSLAMSVLTRAICRHAWTFVGSGSLHYRRSGDAMLIGIEGSPLARGTVGDAPVCDYYAASFERLFRGLVDARLRVDELECAAAGAPRCVFRVAAAAGDAA